MLFLPWIHELFSESERVWFVWKVGWRSLNPGELGEGNVGQAVTEWSGSRAIQDVEPGFRRDVGLVGKEVGVLRIAAVPSAGERVVQAADAERVASLERILVRLCLTAEHGKDIRAVRRRVRIVEIEVDALANAGLRLASELADESLDGIAAASTEAADVACANICVVASRGGEALVILLGAGPGDI